MPNTFFIKTTLEWASTSMNSYIIPRGDLCIETFDDGDMKLKIGDGLRVFKQLPYICHGHDDKKYDYYTKEEIDKMFDDITIDLDNYYNKTEIDELMSSLRSNLIQYIDNNTHYHHNKAILDQITAPFTREEKEKLANIIDVSGYAERIEVLEAIAHTHDNKNVLDLITVADVNNWHVHSNKLILDNTTASFTVNYKNILDNLVTYNVFEPASAYESGSVGLVPAPNVGDHIKFLRGDGKWVSVEAVTIPVATTETLGGIIVGNGLTITENGILSASGVLSITQDQDNLNELIIEYDDHSDQFVIPNTEYYEGTAIDIITSEDQNINERRIQYIEFPPEYQNFIRLNYSPIENTNIELECEIYPNSSYNCGIFGTRYDLSAYTTESFQLGMGNDGLSLSWGRGDSLETADSKFSGFVTAQSNHLTNTHLLIKTTGSTLTVTNMDTGDVLINEDHPLQFTGSDYNMNLFSIARKDTSGYSDPNAGKIYSFKIYEGTTLVRNYVPVEHNTYGIVLHEMISDTYHAPNSSTNVNAGPYIDQIPNSINVLYADGLDVNDDNELINTGILDVNVNEQDSSKLDIEFYDHTKTITIPGDYELPPATTEVLGGIIVGNGLSITEGGVLSADAITIDEYVISVTQDEQFLNILHVEYPDGIVDITLPQSEGKVEVDEPEEELIISGSYGPGGKIYTAGAGISITESSSDDRHLPDEYKQIQYIESNELNQYLDTEILIIPGIRIECDCEVSDDSTSTYQSIFGTKYADSSQCFIFWTRFNSQNIPCFASPSSGEVTGTGFVYNTRTKIVATQSNASWYIDNTLAGSINGSGNWSYNEPIILFGCGKQGVVESGCKAKCYEFKAYNGDILTNDLIPCVEIATGEVGMYDLIANKFCKAVDDGVTREPFVAGPDLITDSFITNTGVLDITVNEEDNTVLDVTFHDETKHIQMSGGSSYDDSELRSLIAALTTQVQTLQTELNTLKTKAVLSDDIRHIDKVTMDEYLSMVRSNDTMYLINDEAGELEPSSSVIPTNTLATSIDNIDITIIGDLEEVE